MNTRENSINFELNPENNLDQKTGNQQVIPESSIESFDQIDQQNFRFRTKGVSLEGVSDRIGFDEKTKNLSRQILSKYKEYPKVQAVILEAIDEVADYDYLKINSQDIYEQLELFNRQDIFELIKLYEDNLSGNEGHLVSRIDELGKKFLDEVDVLVYDNKKDTNSVYTVGRGTWASGGAWGSTTPSIASSNDRSSYAVKYDIVKK